MLVIRAVCASLLSGAIGLWAFPDTRHTRVRGSLSHDSGVSVSVSHGQDGTQHVRVTLVREAGPFTTALLLPLYIINAPLSPAQARLKSGI